MADNLWMHFTRMSSYADAPVPRRASATGDPLRVAVVRFPRISNFTDVDALGVEPDVEVRFAARPADLVDADLVVLPGTRSTIADLDWLRSRGLDHAVAGHVAAGRPVLGICGGFQMLGSSVDDPGGVKGPPGTSVPGLGLLDVRTEFSPEKVLALATGSALGAAVSGYEIHHGVVFGAGEELTRRDHVFGTMWHGALESDEFRSVFLAEVAALVGRHRVPSGVGFAAARQARLDLLADLVEKHVSVDELTALITDGAPEGLPVLPPGDRR